MVRCVKGHVNPSVEETLLRNRTLQLHHPALCCANCNLRTQNDGVHDSKTQKISGSEGFGVNVREISDQCHKEFRLMSLSFIAVNIRITCPPQKKKYV